MFADYYVQGLLYRPVLPLSCIGKQILASFAKAAAILAFRSVLPWPNMYVTVGLVFFGREYTESC